METTIGKRIRQLREAKGLSVADFAKSAGVKPSAIYGLESDANKPSIETVAMLRQSFPDLNSEWLQFGDGPMLKGGPLTPISQMEPATQAAAQETMSYGDAVELAVANARIADRDEIIRKKDERITELLLELGKSNDSPDAAGPLPTTPRKPVSGFLTAAQRAEIANAFNNLVEEELSEGNLVAVGR